MRYLSDLEGALVSGGDVAEVIVIAPKSVTLGPGSSPGVYYTDSYAQQMAATLAYGNLMTNYYVAQAGASVYAATHVVVQSTSTDPHVLAAIDHLKSSQAQAHMQLDMDRMGLGSSATSRLPGSASITAANALAIMDKTTIVVSDQQYGPDRAGENNIDPVTGNITVTINADKLAEYDGSPGGMNYLIFHEIGHDTLQGMANHAADWAHFTALPANQGHTAAQVMADWWTSDDFHHDEAWANTAALDMATAFGIGPYIGSVPFYGYLPN